METTIGSDEGFSGKTVGEIVAQNYKTADVFKSHGIDFCCGGDVTVEKACLEHNVDQDELVQELEKKLDQGKPYGKQYDTWELGFYGLHRAATSPIYAQGVARNR